MNIAGAVGLVVFAGTAIGGDQFIIGIGGDTQNCSDGHISPTPYTVDCPVFGGCAGTYRNVGHGTASAGYGLIRIRATHTGSIGLNTCGSGSASGGGVNVTQEFVFSGPGPTVRARPVLQIAGTMSAAGGTCHAPPPFDFPGVASYFIRVRLSPSNLFNAMSFGVNAGDCMCTTAVSYNSLPFPAELGSFSGQLVGEEVEFFTGSVYSIQMIVEANTDSVQGCDSNTYSEIDLSSPVFAARDGGGSIPGGVHWASDGAFILPPGYTVNSPNANVVDNHWIDPRPVAAAPTGSTSLCPNGSASLSVSAAGAGTLTYQWRHGGVALADGVQADGSMISGAADATLQITGTVAASAGAYDCVVTNDVDSSTSPAVDLHYCSADFTCDGMVEDADFVLFATAYDLFLCSDPSMPANCPGDLSGDGFVDDTDFVLFAGAYDALLCE